MHDYHTTILFTKAVIIMIVGYLIAHYIIKYVDDE